MQIIVSCLLMWHVKEDSPMVASFEIPVFAKNCQHNKLNVPPDNILKGRKRPVPYVFVADDAFAMQVHIMKPYSGTQQKGSIERIFNYRLSKARRIVENAFGILSSVFRVLRKSLLLEPRKAEKVLLTCLYLHNFILIH